MTSQPETIDKSNPLLEILLPPTEFYTFQFPPNTPIQPSIYTNPIYDFASITKTPEELSIVLGYKEGELPAGGGGVHDIEEQATEVDGPWRCLRVRGPMDLGMVGIMNELTKPLRQGSIPVFAISTWNTDYVLVPSGKVTEAQRVLQQDGWVVTPSTGTEGS